MMGRLDIHQFACLTDNYGYLVHDRDSGTTAAIDSPDPAAIERELAVRGWTLDLILNTHHHADHAGGNLALKARFGCRIVGPRADAERIPGLDVAVADGDSVDVGRRRAVVFDTPGHTRGHICYYFATEAAAFVGDTLFSMGCGRLFEGTPSQMWTSLGKLSALPDDTRIYCAHEYTQKNARFAATLEPKNPALHERIAEVDALRAANRPTIPSTIGLEKRTNPMLRAASSELRQTLSLETASDVEVFAETRRRRDRF